MKEPEIEEVQELSDTQDTDETWKKSRKWTWSNVMESNDEFFGIKI